MDQHLAEVVAATRRLARDLEHLADQLAELKLDSATSSVSRPRYLTNAIEVILAEASEPLGPKAIQGALRTRYDWHAPYHTIGSTLSYLARDGRARRLGYGQWIAQG